MFAPFTARPLPTSRKQPSCPPPSVQQVTVSCLSPRIREQFPGTEMEKYSLFIYESLKKTKCREFVPSRDEIEALIHRQEMTSMVYCHGGGSCKITINSHTTAGEVRKRPLRRTLSDTRLPTRVSQERCARLNRPSCPAVVGIVGCSVNTETNVPRDQPTFIKR